MARDPPAARMTLVFDGNCASCKRFASMVRRMDTKKLIRFASMYDPEVEERLRPRVGPAYDKSFHLVNEATGEVVSGEDALPDLAALLPVAAPFGAVAFKIPAVRGLPAAIYRAFSAGRTCAADTAGRQSKD